jgi:hypothetical protein
LQYTIEARELTNESTHRPAVDSATSQTTLEARDADDAIRRFVQQSHSELVSLIRPARGRESIATVKKDDAVLLLRVYAV